MNSNKPKFELGDLVTLKIKTKTLDNDTKINLNGIGVVTHRYQYPNELSGDLKRYKYISWNYQLDNETHNFLEYQLRLVTRDKLQIDLLSI